MGQSYNRYGFWAVLLLGIAVLLFIAWLSMAHAQSRTVAVTVKDGAKTVATGTLDFLIFDGISYTMTMTLKGNVVVISQAPTPVSGAKVFLNGSPTEQFKRIDLSTK
jgi:hypothetical protein